ncbi:hypothetical protein K2173_022559 [Erythroxylum novogranatense]|uniref:FCP1 homology domain-containing protein n=1 Tax=Erythroxylum novogranatense TaxID=1862640 RepID=A0AAV8TKD5_9ROSI|nr:hypothetical protein K2173_022559 [Erythroxylum novogranatense]
MLMDRAPWNPNRIFWEQAGMIHQGNNLGSYLGVSDEEDYSWNLCVISLQELLQTISPYRSFSLEIQPHKGFPITLVLDLDETLVHSSFDICEDADFSFQIHSKMQVQTVSVRQRPYLRMFLEAVSSMFDIVIFTAGQSYYAEQLLDIIDPNRSLICQRVYRDSCVFANGGYLKDLTILGRDLARIMIVDNSPQVFQLQAENGIPIESWFGDPEDSALLSLLLFLETLVGAEDVRPLIKKKYGYQ